MNPSLNELTIAQAAQGLRRKKFSSVELTSSCLDAIKEKNQELHAYLEVFDDALEAARRADDMFRDGHMPPVTCGIPLAVKDNMLIEGKRTTAGSNMLRSYTAPYDATVIKKLKDQGAVFLGKTNLDEFAMGSSTENSAFGPTKNPHDTSRVPGGSSGGSAAAVAAHMCLGALGSDTGGSIRQPASFCGIVGFKPTYGSVSRSGLIAMASSLDQIGPMTKTVEDALLLFRAIRGKDVFDATSQDGARPWTEEALPELSKIRIGVPKEYFASGLDADVAKKMREAIAKLESNGARIAEISLPASQYALAAYYIIVPSEVSANLARFDGIRYGHRTDNPETLFDAYARSRDEGFGTEVKRRIMLGTYALSAGYYDAYYLKAQKVRRLITNDFLRAFKTVDVIMGPTTPTPAFAFGEHTDDPLAMYLADIYTVAVNLAGLPALSIPAGRIEKNGINLPIGIQLIGKHFQDEKLLAIGHVCEQYLNPVS